MTRRSHVTALAAVFALTSFSVMLAAQQQPHRAGAPEWAGARVRRGACLCPARLSRVATEHRRNGSSHGEAR